MGISRTLGSDLECIVLLTAIHNRILVYQDHAFTRSSAKLLSYLIASTMVYHIRAGLSYKSNILYSMDSRLQLKNVD